MCRPLSAMTSFRPTVNPANFKLRMARLSADFFRLVVEPARPLWRDPEQVRSRRGLLSAFGRFVATYLRDLVDRVDFVPEFLIARTLNMIRRRVALSAAERVTFFDFFFTHILSVLYS